MADSVLPCIVCGKELESALPEDLDTPTINQPHDGTVFTSHGNYGSTAWDPCTDRFLEITICDECLVARSERVLRGIPIVRHEVSYDPWDPTE